MMRILIPFDNPGERYFENARLKDKDERKVYEYAKQIGLEAAGSVC